MRAALLSSLHTDQRDKLQLDMYLPRAQEAARGRPRNSMRELRVSRLRKQRLSVAHRGDQKYAVTRANAHILCATFAQIQASLGLEHCQDQPEDHWRGPPSRGDVIRHVKLQDRRAGKLGNAQNAYYVWSMIRGGHDAANARIQALLFRPASISCWEVVHLPRSNRCHYHRTPIRS